MSDSASQSWLSLSGHPLKGDVVTRFAFLDDAGVSKHEPRFLVAGVLMHRDRQSAVLEDELMAIARRICPERPNVVLHASDLWHGSRDFPRDKFTQELRRQTVLEVASLPAKHGLPIVFGQCVRERMPALTTVVTKDDKEMSEALPHILAQFACSSMIDLWMRRNASDEVAQLVHEDMPRSKASLKLFHNFARDPVVGPKLAPGITPYRHIKGPLYYANKHEERLLQIADTCAFVISRHLANNEDISLVFDALKPRIFELDASLML